MAGNGERRENNRNEVFYVFYLNFFLPLCKLTYSVESAKEASTDCCVFFFFLLLFAVIFLSTLFSISLCVCARRPLQFAFQHSSKRYEMSWQYWWLHWTWSGWFDILRAHCSCCQSTVCISMFTSFIRTFSDNYNPLHSMEESMRRKIHQIYM